MAGGNHLNLMIDATGAEVSLGMIKNEDYLLSTDRQCLYIHDPSGRNQIATFHSGLLDLGKYEIAATRGRFQSSIFGVITGPLVPTNGVFFASISPFHDKFDVILKRAGKEGYSLADWDRSFPEAIYAPHNEDKDLIAIKNNKTGEEIIAKDPSLEDVLAGFMPGTIEEISSYLKLLDEMETNKVPSAIPSFSSWFETIRAAIVATNNEFLPERATA
jgi:hypothetical protein